MKKLLATIWLLSLSASTFLSLVQLSDYAMRYSYYVNVLCENKENTEMHCNGTCQLSMTEDVLGDEEPVVPEVQDFRILALPFQSEEQSNDFSEWDASGSMTAYRSVLPSPVWIGVATPPPWFC